MTRLIDADNLKKAINTWDEFACLPDCKLEPFRNLEHPEMFEPYVHLRDILKAINNAPTVAVDNYCLGYQDGLEKGAEKEKTEGEWIHYLGCGVGNAICSVCGQLGETKKYCGNCGRRMRGGYS